MRSHEDATFKKGLAQKRQIKADIKKSTVVLSERERRALLRDKNKPKVLTPVKNKQVSAKEEEPIPHEEKEQIVCPDT